MTEPLSHGSLSQPIIRRMNLEEEAADPERLLKTEWLLANGLGGYASSSVSGICTRKYHGLLVAALPAPNGRMVMLSTLREEIRLPDGTEAQLSGEHRGEGELILPGRDTLKEFLLEDGLPLWRYGIKDVMIEKRILIPHFQNSVYIHYRLLSGHGPVRLRLRPFLSIRALHDELKNSPEEPYHVRVAGDRFEVIKNSEVPPLRLYLYGSEGSFSLMGGDSFENYYPIEEGRGLPARGWTWSPGCFGVMIPVGKTAALVASTEPWDVVQALKPEGALHAEQERRQRLLAAARPEARSGRGPELVLSADQFIIAPIARTGDAARAHARGDEIRTVIAGYHWFTDWGRDTMISLEGLTMVTGRLPEASYVLRTFASYVRDGLIPNMFPEGQIEARYNTADATLWFFHAIDRYLQFTHDEMTLRQLLPVLKDIVDHHIRGTFFGIGMDPQDGLLRQGEAGYPLTWMDARVGDWVVTPRRGKAVEVNALWYNALCLMRRWLEVTEHPKAAQEISTLANRTYVSFNEKFWYDRGGYLYDVVDGESGSDPSLRPNQVFAISLPHPVLDSSRWKSVMHVVRKRLLTPVGLRSLEPDHPDYKMKYGGDLLARDAAYHQGTVWSWLIGPFVDAWLRIYPEDRPAARGFLHRLIDHLDEGCVGSVSEVFDGDPPFHPGGCISQAWSVAELLRAWIRTAE